MEATKPHIVLIAYYFRPANAIGGVRPYRFYKYLKKSGYTCTVITASAQGAGGASDIIVVPDEIGAIWESKDKTKLSFAARIEWLVRRFAFPGATGVVWARDAARVCREVLDRRQDQRPLVLYTTFPPLGVLLAGLLAGRDKRVAGWISDFRDPLFPRVSSRYDTAFNLALAHRLEAHVIRSAHAAVANTKAMALEWARMYPRLGKNVHVIFNGFDPEERLWARDIPARDSRVILHAGALYGGRRPTVILESLRRLRKTAPEVRDVRIVLQGSIGHQGDLPPGLVEEAVRDGWLEIRDHTISRSEAERLTAEADGLLLLQPQSAIQIPGKLFEYICVGRPILALVPQSSAVQEVLAEAGIPFRCIHPDDPPEVVDRKLLDYLALPNRPACFSESFETGFSAVRQTQQLRTIIGALAAPAGRSRMSVC